MPAPKPTLLPIQLPFGGVDRSKAFADQPLGTTANALNVRTVDLRDRQALGKRNGYGRMFTPQAGAVGNRRIIGLVPLSLATGSAASAGQIVETIVDSFEQYYADSASPKTQPDLLGNWVYFVPAGGGSSLTGTGSVWQLTTSTLHHGVKLTSGGYMLCNYRTSNDVTARFTATALTTVGVNRFRCCTVAIRGNDTWTQWIMVRVEAATGNTAKVHFYKVVAGVTTQIGASSAAIALNIADTTETDDLKIRLYIANGLLNADISWPSKVSEATAPDARWAGFTYSVTDTEPTINGFRAGVACTNSSGADTILVNQTTLTRTRPIDRPIVGQLNGNDTPPDTNAFFVPSGWIGFLNASGTITLGTGQITAAAQPNYPSLDNTDLSIQAKTQAAGNTTGAQSTSGILLADPTGDPGTDLWAVEYKNNAADAGKNVHAFFRVDTTYKNYLAATATSLIDSDSTNKGGISTLTALFAMQVVNGSKTQLATATMSVPIYLNGWFRLTDSGGQGGSTSGTVTLQQNGMTVLSLAYSGLNVAVTGKRVAFAPVGSTSAGVAHARVTKLSGVSSLAVGEYTSRILVMSNGITQHGRLDIPGTLTTTTGGGPLNALPIAMSFNNKWYIVDGGVSLVVDPIANTCVNWLATLGTFPQGCRLTCLYRGRAVLARQDTNPSIWYMSRTLDPNDWLIGADPTATAAVAGTDARIGLPGDAITALIPFNDDLLYMGCAGSIWMMEGDPGYGGQIQNVTDTIGVVGPRAFVFDEGGNLFFLGPKGLYRIERGGNNPTGVDGGRLPAYLDRVNLDQTLVQMAYDKFRANVHIFLTPTDGTTVGTHVVFNIRSQQMWIDQFPVFFGPWAVCDIEGVRDEDRRFLIGGNDGFVRRPLDANPNDDKITHGDPDDGTGANQAIDSWVEIGPFELSRGDVEGCATEINAYISSNTTEAVSWLWYVGRSPEEVAAQTFGQEVASGTWGGMTLGTGFQVPAGLRQRGGCHKIRIRQTSATGEWGVERIWGLIQARSRRR